MAYWLLKSEPEAWSWQDQVQSQKTNWDGVRNYQACNNMKAMKKGDFAFFYHSGTERKIVGIVRITGEYTLDPSDKSQRFGMVEVTTVSPVPQPVSLTEIKDDARLSHLALVRQSRLSVMPIDAAAWKIICNKGKFTP